MLYAKRFQVPVNQRKQPVRTVIDSIEVRAGLPLFPGCQRFAPVQKRGLQEQFVPEHVSALARARIRREGLCFPAVERRLYDADIVRPRIALLYAVVGVVQPPPEHHPWLDDAVQPGIDRLQVLGEVLVVAQRTARVSGCDIRDTACDANIAASFHPLPRANVRQ
jgi:hypothetical protein